MKHIEGPYVVAKDATDGAWNVFPPGGGPTCIAKFQHKADAVKFAKAQQMAALLRELDEHFDSFFGIPERHHVERVKALLAESEEHE